MNIIFNSKKIGPKKKLYILPSLLIILLLVCSILTFTAAESPSSRAESFNLELFFDQPLEDDNLVLYPGDYYHFYVRITNTGDNNDTYDLEIIFNNAVPGWKVNFYDKSTKMDVQVPSAGNGDNTVDVLVAVSVPETAKKGDFADISFKAQSKSNSAVQTEPLMITISYVPPHILLETVEAELEAEPGGDPVTFSVKAKNLGFETVDYFPPSSSEFKIPENWELTISSSGIAVTLEPGEFRIFHVNVSVPASTDAQEKLTLVVEGATNSFNTTILPVELRVTVKQIHDIDIDAPESKTILEPLVEISYDVIVRNDGNGPESIEVGLNIPSAVSGWNVVLSEISHILPPGNKHTIRINFTPTLDAENDEYEFELYVNIIESSVIIQTETFTTTVEINYVPDLAINNTDIYSFETALEPEQRTMINATIHNVGRVTAYNVTIKFEYITRGGSQKEIGSLVIPEIPAGEMKTAGIEWTVDHATSFLTVSIDPSNKILETEEDNNDAIQSVLVIQPGADPSSPSSKSTSGVIGIGSIGAVVVLTALFTITFAMIITIINSEAARYGLLSSFMPLYTKVKREDVLIHKTREQVFDHIKQHPGEHFRAIMNKLSLTNGTLAHHLYTLEKQEFIKSERDGPYKRFYPRGFQFTGSVMEVNGLQKKILDTIEDNPGISQKQLAQILNISPPTVNYHIKTMVGARLVELNRNGKETQLFRIKAE